MPDVGAQEAARIEGAEARSEVLSVKERSGWVCVPRSWGNGGAGAGSPGAMGLPSSDVGHLLREGSSMRWLWGEKPGHVPQVQPALGVAGIGCVKGGAAGTRHVLPCPASPSLRAVSLWGVAQSNCPARQVWDMVGCELVENCVC